MRIFIDCDEVLLSFDELLKDELKEILPDLDLSLINKRQNFCLSSVKKYNISKDHVFFLVEKIFIEKKHRNQKMCLEILHQKDKMSKILNDPRAAVLTKIPSYAYHSRLECLNEHFNVDLNQKLYTVYHNETKANKILSLIEGEIYSPKDVFLVDDHPENLEPWLLAGGKGILIKRSYNKKEENIFKKLYPDSFLAINGDCLADVLEKILSK